MIGALTGLILGAIVDMKDAGFIIGSYVATFLAVIAFAAATFRRARRLGRRIPREETYWS